MRKKLSSFTIKSLVVLLFSSMIGINVGCTSVQNNSNVTNGGDKMEYKHIDMETAKGIFEEPGDYIILDVRTVDEYNSGHIPGAINVPNEEISNTEVAELPDKKQTIYVYCRSGNRSTQAAKKLAAIGYENIIEFGGIMDWTGEIEK